MSTSVESTANTIAHAVCFPTTHGRGASEQRVSLPALAASAWDGACVPPWSLGRRRAAAGYGPPVPPLRPSAAALLASFVGDVRSCPPQSLLASAPVTVRQYPPHYPQHAACALPGPRSRPLLCLYGTLQCPETAPAVAATTAFRPPQPPLGRLRRGVMTSSYRRQELRPCARRAAARRTTNAVLCYPAVGWLGVLAGAHVFSTEQALTMSAAHEQNNLMHADGCTRHARPAVPGHTPLS